jgi:hypothetical protein
LAGTKEVEKSLFVYFLDIRAFKGQNFPKLKQPYPKTGLTGLGAFSTLPGVTEPKNL